MTTIKTVFAGFMLFSVLSACNKNKTSTTDFTINISGLEDLGNNYRYEGWLMVSGSPISAGIFSVDNSGNLSQRTFSIDDEKLKNATAYVLTIEPFPDNDPAPTKVHILAGDFSGNSANLTVKHSAALGTDFTTATGSFMLATPTDGNNTTNEKSGVWFLNMPGPVAGLSLPNLPDGWKYEGWAVVNGTPLSTGRFTNVTGADEGAPYNATNASAPPFPGEDFLRNAPAGLSFPVDLAGKVVAISVEPIPDNSPAPFLLKPLLTTVPAAAVPFVSYSLANNAVSTNPTGTVSR